MGLAGQGAVAIWHDIESEARAEFYAWHGGQHMPERAAIPGFLRGRRYVEIDGQSPEFFNLYETTSGATVTSREYLECLEHPTPWTVANVRHFRGVARSLCAVAASFGEGQGGLIATFRYDVRNPATAAHRERLAQQVLPALAASPDVAGCHLLIADPAASAFETAEKKLRVEKNEIPRWILLVESWGDIDPFRAFVRRVADSEALADAVAPPQTGIYRMQNSRITHAAEAR